MIARALAKIPDQRFPSCQETVESLFSASRPSAPAGSFPGSMRSTVEGLEHNGASPSREPKGEEPAVCPTILEMDTAPSPGVAISLFPSPATASASPNCYTRSRWADTLGAFTIRPTLFLSTGGLAGKTFRQLRNRLHLRFGNMDRIPIFCFLLLDTDRKR